MTETIKPKVDMGEFIPHHEEIVVATNFYYKDFQRLTSDKERDIADTAGIRGDLALETIRSLLSKGIHVVAADGGSSSDFLDELQYFENQGLTLIKSKKAGLAPQRKDSFEIATQISRAKAIVYLQPEKVHLVDFLERLVQPIIDETTDIVIPARNQELFIKTYPNYMVSSEMQVNKTYNRLVKRFLERNGQLLEEDLDWFFGPFVFRNNPDIAPLFLESYVIPRKGIPSREDRVNAELKFEPESTTTQTYSASHYFPIIKALSQGRKITKIEVPFEYPDTQFTNEERSQMRDEFIKRRKRDSLLYRFELLEIIKFLEGKDHNIIYIGNSH